LSKIGLKTNTRRFDTPDQTDSDKSVNQNSGDEKATSALKKKKKKIQRYSQLYADQIRVMRMSKKSDLNVVQG
jgi:hypothetical protein